MPAEQIRVLIVDDHEMVREGLKVLLTRDKTLDVVAEAATGLEALELVPLARPDVVLMDLTMPVMDGAEATARIRDQYPDVQVVVLSGVGDSVLVEDALDAGAVGYLVKDSHHEVVAQAIHEASQGRGHVDSSALQAIMDRRRAGPGSDLTRREREVLALLVEGLSNAEIGARLQLSTGTVRLHVGHLLAKLQAPNRTAAAVIAVENAIV
jgi:two-component system, NarL family, response regulator LiaR